MNLNQNISRFLSNIVDSLPMHFVCFSSVPERYENSYTDLIIFLGIRVAISINFIRFLNGFEKFVLIHIILIHIDIFKVQFATIFK